MDRLVKKIFFPCLILFVISNNISLAIIPDLSDLDISGSDKSGSGLSEQKSSVHPFVVMSDGKKTGAIPIEEFLKVAMKNATQNGTQKDFQDILGAKQNLGKESFQDLINTALKDSFVVDMLKESAKESGKAIKSIAKSVIKGIAVGVTMGIVLLIGGAIVWQVLVVPVYCKGPGPTIASWMPVSDYWQWGEDGICRNYVSQENNVLIQESKLKHVAQLISQNISNVVLPDGSVNRNIPGYCKIEDGEIVWCDKSLCKIDKNIRGC
jgi:hypothetical protein